jgi:succinate dehydrogenase / fumarate reductase flavoprotein subunit
LADGYFVLPYTIGDYLADYIKAGKVPTDTPEFDEAEQKVMEEINFFLTNKGTHSVDYFHKKLGKIMWDKVGLSRNAQGLQEAIKEIQELRHEFWKDVRVPGKATDYNPELEKAGYVADYLELGELLALDALNRNESCGGHFREEYQTPDGEALRDDEHYAYVAAWEYPAKPYERYTKPVNVSEEILHKEPLIFEFVKPTTRSYK